MLSEISWIIRVYYFKLLLVFAFIFENEDNLKLESVLIAVFFVFGLFDRLVLKRYS